MKAITLWQPWASLVACGVKTIETRSWQTSHRGPIAIHAAQRRPDFAEMATAGFIAPLVAAGLDPSRFDRWGSYKGDEDDWYWTRIGEQAVPVGVPLPIGAVVATANLVDCAPMGWWDSFSTGIVEGGEPDFAGRHVLVMQPDWDLTLDHPPGCGHNTGTAQDVTAQRPYGDFAPGRWAWLLEDVEVLDPPVPARGGQRIWTWERSSPVVGCR